ncbi:type II toxin-antitoxin system VapC family toxin [Mucilaginibacter ximonensis]|uniref:Type II toxin-antitoxin system VapC family toxin n=1 Tax=Mucilaginibacter ximonensis TaxID=538021 RepID=A0ABW5YAY4_9SPHI
MASKIFVDANLLLDFSLKRDNYAVSKQLIQLIIDGEVQAFITPSIVHITSYWLTKAYGTDKAKQLLLQLLTDIQVIDCTHAITINALNSKMTDIEDALQYYTALHHKIDFFISEDKGLQKSAIPNLPVYSSKDFLNLL